MSRRLRAFFLLLARKARKGGSAASGRNTGANGRLPASALSSIGGGHRLVKFVAGAYLAMKSAAARAGVSWGVTDSYRSYAAQLSVARRKGLYSKGGLAAVPGTSNHGWGRAVDLALNSRAYNWLRANAARFGFRSIPREKWHWEYRR